MQILILFFLLQTILIPKVMAASVYTGETYWAAGAAPTTLCDNQSVCGTQPEQFCYNNQTPGAGSSCGFGCSAGDAWKKYSISSFCVVNPLVNLEPDQACTWARSVVALACSTADKYNFNNPPVLNAGRCTCQAGGPYKTCCSGRFTVNAILYSNTNPPNPAGPDGACGNNTPVLCGDAGQPACGQAACAVSTPTPTPTPPAGCTSAPTNSPPKNTPQFVFGSCPNGQFCSTPCSDTCTVGGQTCPATSCASWWQCQGGTQWYNDGTYYPICPANCGVCIPGQTRTTCDPTTKTCILP